MFIIISIPLYIFVLMFQSTSSSSRSRGHGVEGGTGNYAKIGDNCIAESYENAMKPFYVALVEKNLTTARNIFSNLQNKMETLNDTHRIQFVREICFGAALQCTSTGKCECLSFRTKQPNFHFVESGGQCKAGKDTACNVHGFNCAEKLKCDPKTSKCQDSSSSSSPVFLGVSWLPLSILMLLDFS